MLASAYVAITRLLHMDEKIIAERIQYFQQIAAEYGYCIVPASLVYQTFEEIAQPSKLGFTMIRAGFYGKVVNEEIVHLLKLQALKGASYIVWWGVSLPFVPHKWDSGLRWHRTFRSSRFDLFETPFDYFSLTIADWREEVKYVVGRFHGELYLRKSMDEMWRLLRPEVLSWFISTESLEGVLEKAREQVERGWFGHHPDPLMVYAFTLARLGQIQEARDTLNRYFRMRYESLSAQENLKKALESALANNSLQPTAPSARFARLGRSG